ncbi:MAG: hypothetical protein QM817_12780 [Archangium sp.]
MCRLWVVGALLLLGCEPAPCVTSGKYEFYAVLTAGSSVASCPATLSGSVTWGADTTFEVAGFKGNCQITDVLSKVGEACEMNMRCHGTEDSTGADATLTTFSFVEPGKRTTFVRGSGGLVGQPMIPAQWIQPRSQCVGAYTWTARLQ